MAAEKARREPALSQASAGSRSIARPPKSSPQKPQPFSSPTTPFRNSSEGNCLGTNPPPRVFALYPNLITPEYPPGTRLRSAIPKPRDCGPRKVGELYWVPPVPHILLCLHCPLPRFFCAIIWGREAAHRAGAVPGMYPHGPRQQRPGSLPCRGGLWGSGCCLIPLPSTPCPPLLGGLVLSTVLNMEGRALLLIHPTNKPLPSV